MFHKSIFVAKIFLTSFLLSLFLNVASATLSLLVNKTKLSCRYQYSVWNKKMCFWIVLPKKNFLRPRKKNFFRSRKKNFFRRLIWQNFFFLDLKKFFFLGLVNYTFFIICLCFTFFWAFLYSCFVYCLGNLFFKFVLGIFPKKKTFFYRSKKKNLDVPKKVFWSKKA